MSNEDKMTLVMTRVTKWKVPNSGAPGSYGAYKIHLSNRFVFTVRIRRSAAAFLIKMRFLTWYLVLAECPVFFTQAQKRYDTCPGVEPMQDFQINRFLGQWYVIQDTAMYGKCITYNYRQVQEPDRYVILVMEHISQADSSTYASRAVYHLIVLEPNTPGRKEGNYYAVYSEEDGFMVNMSHVVFMTDYDTYAGVFKYLPNYEPRVTILSRTNTLDQMHVDKIHQKLSQCGFDLSKLKIIEHSDFP